MLLNKDLFFFIYFFLGLSTIPTAVFYLLGTSSMFHGLLIYNSLLFLLLLFFDKLKFDKNILSKVIFSFISIFFYTLLMGSIYINEISYIKPIMSFFAILTFVIILIPIVDYLQYINEKTLQRSLDIVFYVLTLFALYASIFHIFFLSHKDIITYIDKTFLIYQEPSHFSLIVLPFFILLCTTTKAINAINYYFYVFVFCLYYSKFTLISGYFVYTFIYFSKT